MWKKIQSNDSVITIHLGDIVSQIPNDPFCEFRVQGLDKGYVAIFDTNGEEEMKHFPLNDLKKDNWWVKN